MKTTLAFAALVFAVGCSGGTSGTTSSGSGTSGGSTSGTSTASGTSTGGTSSSACAGKAMGLYCGSDLGLTPSNEKYQCSSSGVLTDLGGCSASCASGVCVSVTTTGATSATATATGSGTGTSGSGTTGGQTTSATTGFGFPTGGLGPGTGGISGGTGGDRNVCSPDAGAGPFAGCSTNSACSCPELCVFDYGFGGSYCEVPCTGTGAAPCAATNNPLFTCQVADGGVDGGVGAINVCEIDFCASSLSGTAPGSFAAPCTVSTTNDGTCNPSVYPLIDGGFVPIGACFPNGTVTDGGLCSLMMAGALCEPGLICALNPTSGAGQCAPFCTDSSTCTGGNVCVSLFPGDPSIGSCAACVTTGNACNFTGDCCTGTTCSNPDSGAPQTCG